MFFFYGKMASLSKLFFVLGQNTKFWKEEGKPTQTKKTFRILMLKKLQIGGGTQNNDSKPELEQANSCDLIE